MHKNIFQLSLFVTDGHFRIEKNQDVQCQLSEKFSGHLLIAIVHVNPSYKTRAINASHLFRGLGEKQSCPLRAFSSNGEATYKTVELELSKQSRKTIMTHSAILSLVEEDSFILKFPLISSDVKSEWFSLYIIRTFPKMTYILSYEKFTFEKYFVKITIVNVVLSHLISRNFLSHEVLLKNSVNLPSHCAVCYVYNWIHEIFCERIFPVFRQCIFVVGAIFCCCEIQFVFTNSSNIWCFNFSDFGRTEAAREWELVVIPIDKKMISQVDTPVVPFDSVVNRSYPPIDIQIVSILRSPQK